MAEKWSNVVENRFFSVRRGPLWFKAVYTFNLICMGSANLGVYWKLCFQQGNTRSKACLVWGKCVQNPLFVYLASLPMTYLSLSLWSPTPSSVAILAQLSSFRTTRLTSPFREWWSFKGLGFKAIHSRIYYCFETTEDLKLVNIYHFPKFKKFYMPGPKSWELKSLS